MADLHKAARDKAVERLLSHNEPEARSTTPFQWAVEQYTPSTPAVQHGVRQGIANALALPQFGADVFNVPNTFINNNIYPATPETRQDYFRNFNAASQAYGRDITGATEHENYPRTPGNIVGDTMLQIGTEVMMPLGGGYTALRAPSKLREMQVSTKKVVDPEFDQSRRDFGKTAALSGAGLALGIPAVKQAMKHGDTVVKATPTPAPSGRWNFISDDIYHSRATVGGIDRVHPWARGRLLRDSHGARSNDMVREWKTQYNESRGLSATDEWEGQVMSPGNKPKYNALQDELHQANDRVSHRLNEEMYELSDAEYDHFDDIFREQEGIPDLVDDIQSLVDKDPGVLAYKQQRHQAMMDDIGDELWNIRRSQIQEEIDSVESYIRRKEEVRFSKENLRRLKKEMVEHERLGNRAQVTQNPDTPLSSVGAAMLLDDEEQNQ